MLQRLLVGKADELLSETSIEKVLLQFEGAFNYILGKEKLQNISQDVSFNLYTRKNPQIAQVLPFYPSLIRVSYFNPSLNTYFVIHGYTDHKDREIIARLRLGMYLLK